MKLAGDYLFDASPQEVWDALFDPEILAAAMPGCEKLELVDGQLHGDLNVKVGPISGKFTGKVQLVDQVPPVSYRMIIDGKGPHGFVKASATIDLATEAGGTRMRYDADAQVGGKIATVGQRLIETSAKAITKQSLEGLNENIKIRVAAHRAVQAAATPIAAVTPATPEPPAVVEPEPARPVAQAVAEAVTEVAPVATPVVVTAPEAVEVPAPATATVTAPATVTATATAPAAATVTAAAPVTAPAAAAAPVAIRPQYKRADATKLAGTVTKEVMRVMLPWILVGLLSIALVISLVTR